MQDRSVQTLLKVLLTIKSGDIDGIVKSLDQPQLDILMKYIYRGFEYPSEGSSAQLLTWHEKVTNTNRSIYYSLYFVSKLPVSLCTILLNKSGFLSL